MAITTEPIDAVYLWVDGRDSAFRRRLRMHRRESRLPPGRFRENGELRFSLRSLEQHAPWIRRVYLVTSCRPPGWLDTRHPRLRVVSEDTLFAPGCTPTFNSNAIEWQLRKIPGLSRRFLYLCDDFFLGRPVTPEDFLTSRGGQRIYLDVHWVVPAQPKPESNLYYQSMAFTQGLLDRRFGQTVRKCVTHSPRLYDQRVLKELEEIWPDEIQATRQHRFRQPDDVVLDLLYHHYLLHSATCQDIHQLMPSTNGSDYFFASLVPVLRDTLPLLRRIAITRPKFFCLNDDLGPSFALRTWLVGRHVRFLLRQLFSSPSCFEIGAG